MTVHAQFAKIYQTCHGQLLVYLNESAPAAGEERSVITVVGAHVGDVQPAAHLGYDSEEKRDVAFAKFDDPGNAEAIAAQLFGLVADMTSFRPGNLN